MNQSTTAASSFPDRLRRDRAAVFEELYERAFPEVARLVRRENGSVDDARDAFHDALIIFYEKAVAGRLEIHNDPTAYLLGIARRQWRRRRRNAQRETPLAETEDLKDPAVADEAPAAGPALLGFLERAGRRCLEILQAFYYHRWPMEEIAEQFGYGSARSATVQKYKCLEKVRHEVSQDPAFEKRSRGKKKKATP